METFQFLIKIGRVDRRISHSAIANLRNLCKNVNCTSTRKPCSDFLKKILHNTGRFGAIDIQTYDQKSRFKLFSFRSILII